MFQLLKIHLDEKKPESWENLPRLPYQTRKDWIVSHLKEILATLEADPAIPEEVWHKFGFMCINDIMYKEAETIYDRMYKKYQKQHKNFGIALYYRGIARFLQGRFKEALADFKAARQQDFHCKNTKSHAIAAISYMEGTIFPTRDAIKKNQEKLIEDLNQPRTLDFKVGAGMLKTLHKWNSATPLFSSGLSQGGGYFITLRSPSGETKGIAIDPGYDFYAIMRDFGLGIADIDAIIITHDHDDHTESMEGILSLLAKYNDHNKEKCSKIIDIFGSAGTLLKFHGLLSALDPYGNKEINFNLLVPGNTLTTSGTEDLLKKYGFIIHVKPAYHRERWTNQESSVGLVIETNLPTINNENLSIGITGDTRYEEKLGREYKNCQLLLLNIGSIEKEEGQFLSQHLGMLGCINLLKEARLGKPLLAVLTEFGEEFLGKREIISHIIENWSQPLNGPSSKKTLKVMPADINLEVRLSDLTIRETDTHVFFPYQMIDIEESGSDSLKYKFTG
ncbi:MAG: MBL fold metallo-hydrolase [Candidatus Margulisbacteria bacterium]|nr:MBL fold metallo-hydrolase [Candidatus Margulisiibacteriota bacterium]